MWRKLSGVKAVFEAKPALIRLILLWIINVYRLILIRSLLRLMYDRLGQRVKHVDA